MKSKAKRGDSRRAQPHKSSEQPLPGNSRDTTNSEAEVESDMSTEMGGHSNPTATPSVPEPDTAQQQPTSKEQAKDKRRHPRAAKGL